MCSNEWYGTAVQIKIMCAVRRLICQVPKLVVVPGNINDTTVDIIHKTHNQVNAIVITLRLNIILDITYIKIETLKS